MKTNWFISVLLVLALMCGCSKKSTKPESIPEAPTLYYPASDLTIDDNTPSFDWSDPAGAYRYELIVDNDNSFNSPEIHQADLDSSNYIPSSSLSNDTYYWKVRARNSSGSWGNWSSTWSFIVSAFFHAARYCESGGFSFDNHADEFVLDYYLTCWHGSEFDADISEYIQDDIDIIFIGGDDSFSSSTASSIEDAVYNDGKLLVINFWSNRKFDACLPATNAGNASYGAYLQVVDPQNPIFDGLPLTYVRTGANYNREHAIERDGSTVLMRFDNGDPALLYWKYGDGYVIEWTLELMHVFNFQNQELDTIIYRTIKHCLSLGSVP